MHPARPNRPRAKPLPYNVASPIPERKRQVYPNQWYVSRRTPQRVDLPQRDSYKGRRFREQNSVHPCPTRALSLACVTKDVSLLHVMLFSPRNAVLFHAHAPGLPFGSWSGSWSWKPKTHVGHDPWPSQT
jgi:hypothetical protein